MCEDRLLGYVVACDDGTWKVRVRMDNHSLDGKKFVVASIKDGITLAKAMNVTFLLGTFKKGKKKAIDVTLL